MIILFLLLLVVGEQKTNTMRELSKRKKLWQMCACEIYVLHGQMVIKPLSMRVFATTIKQFTSLLFDVSHNFWMRRKSRQKAIDINMYVGIYCTDVYTFSAAALMSLPAYAKHLLPILPGNNNVNEPICSCISHTYICLYVCMYIYVYDIVIIDKQNGIYCVRLRSTSFLAVTFYFYISSAWNFASHVQCYFGTPIFACVILYYIAFLFFFFWPEI